MWTEPAREAIMVDGGICRSPGPNFMGTEGLGGVGNISGEMLSPGRIKVVIMTDTVFELDRPVKCFAFENRHVIRYLPIGFNLERD
jgi:hypothetical protein